MNNNLYHWHDERMVRHEMHEIDRAVQQARLLREAGSGWLTRAADAVHALRGVGNWLDAARKGALSSLEHFQGKALAPHNKS